MNEKRTPIVLFKNNNQMKNTLILGATTNTDRYAYIAAEMLHSKGYPIFPVGIKKGENFGVKIQNDKTILSNIDTITLYLGPQNQTEWYEYIVQTKPKRVIFNPGTENDELMNLLEANKIQVVQACTLVLLSTNQY